MQNLIMFTIFIPMYEVAYIQNEEMYISLLYNSLINSMWWCPERRMQICSEWLTLDILFREFFYMVALKNLLILSYM